MNTRTLLSALRSNTYSQNQLLRCMSTATTTTTTTSLSSTSSLADVEWLHQFNPQLRNREEEQTKQQHHQSHDLSEDDHNDAVYSLSFLKDNTDFTSTAADFFLPISSIMRRQLNNVLPHSPRSQHQPLQQPPLSSHDPTIPIHPSSPPTHTPKQSSFFVNDYTPLPKTIQEILGSSLSSISRQEGEEEDPRAIVITEAVTPFRITHVNTAWVDLCGYTPEQALGMPIGRLLQNRPNNDDHTQPASININDNDNHNDNNSTLTAAMVHVVLRGESEAGAIVTNYKSNGQPFQNRLRIGPLTSDGTRSGHVTHFVGVLKEEMESS